MVDPAWRGVRMAERCFYCGSMQCCEHDVPCGDGCPLPAGHLFGCPTGQDVPDA